MYKVYLLDDEPFILEGLKYIVDWKDYGFEIVGFANNGEDGLKEILSMDIDLVITDIMMPKMTGLELIENLINSNYQTNFIVLSAFQEFEYAKKAISMGAQNYILKPIDTEELEKSIISIKSKLKEKENRNKDKEVVNNSVLLKLITDKDYENIDYIKEKLKYNVEYRVGIIELKNKDKDIHKVLKVIPDMKKYLYCIENKSKAVFIIDGKSNDEYIEELTNIKNQIIDLIDDIVYISLGEIVKDLKDINISYECAKDISEYKIIYPDISWIKEYKEKNNKNIDIDIDFEDLKYLLINKDFDNASLFIESKFNQLKEDELNPKEIKAKALEVFLNVYNYINESKLIKNLSIYLENVIKKNTIDEIQFELISMIKFMHTKLDNTQESISPVIIKLLNHIEKNYQKDLNLKEISDSLNINSIYLGQLFQKEIGILFSDYINNFRINKAKDLLVNTSLKVSEIGELVGYYNKNYFYRKFKSIVGITPSEWRKLNL
ncbi:MULTISPECIES: response regulator [Romboutsia]|jgi:two-component system response regulator YesN|uniref:response regulator transcription factor n=1 Tax=Romboutsia TaxID=1501226 RepID=UPI00216E0328|nr:MULTISPECIES: response regulator [Romboutsia]MCI9061225.1 response regulator [Romboutsia sp.]